MDYAYPLQPVGISGIPSVALFPELQRLHAGTGEKIRIMGDSLAGEEARLLALQKERMASRDLLAEEISRRQEDQKDLDRRIKQLQKMKGN